MNVNEALACRIWRRMGAGALLRELQSARCGGGVGRVVTVRAG